MLLSTVINVGFFLVILVNMTCGVLLAKAFVKFYRVGNSFELSEFVTKPTEVLALSYLINSIGISILFIYRIILYQLNPEQLIENFRVVDTMTKIYWLTISISGIVFIYVLYLFFTRTAGGNITSVNLFIPFTLLVIGTGYITIQSLLGFIIPINYEIARPIAAFIYFLGSIFLIFGIKIEMNKTTSPTKKGRLYIFLLIIIMLLVWVLISTIAGIYRLNVEFGTVNYFLVSIIITLSAGLTGIIAALLMDTMLPIPNWIRKKYSISQNRYNTYQKMNDL